MPLSIAQTKTKKNVFGEIQKGWPQQAAGKNWTENNFNFSPPADHWLLTLKTNFEVKVDVKWETGKGFRVYLLGTLDKGGGQAKTAVGSLPGVG